MLGYFKYTGFFLDSINVVLAKFCIAPVEIEWNIALPIGISFYTLTALGYLIDVYRGKAEAEHNFLRYALFVSFFHRFCQVRLNVRRICYGSFEIAV